jgi:hypothetical protein
VVLSKGNFKGRKKGAKDKKKRRRRNGLVRAAIGGSIAALPVAAYLHDAKQGEIRAISEKVIKSKYPQGATNTSHYWNVEIPKANSEAKKLVNAKRAKVLGLNISANARNLGLVAGVGLLGAGVGYGISKLRKEKEPKEKRKSSWKDAAKVIGVGLGGAVVGGAVLGLAMKNNATKKAVSYLNQKRRQLAKGIDPTKDYETGLLNVKDKLYNESDNLALQLENLMKPLSNKEKSLLKVDGHYTDMDLNIQLPKMNVTKRGVAKNEFLSRMAKQERRSDIKKAGLVGVGIGATTVGLGSAGTYTVVRNKKSKNKRSR